MAEQRDPNETSTMDEYPQATQFPTASEATAVASEAVDPVAPDASSPPAEPVEGSDASGVTASSESSEMTPATEATSATAATDPSPEPARSASGYQPPAPSGWSDALTGTDGPHLWDRVLASEAARVRRYHRPATVALVEIVGMDAFTRVWGTEIAERTFIRIARTLAVEIRSSDHIARVDGMRFAVLLTETDEIAAINFVERARAACERQPGELRIAIGWASPTADSDLVEALTVAERRLLAELDPTPADADPD